MCKIELSIKNCNLCRNNKQMQKECRSRHVDQQKSAEKMLQVNYSE